MPERRSCLLTWDNNGSLDLVVSGGPILNDLFIYFNNGAGFDQPVIYLDGFSNPGVISYTLGDAEGDGDQDIWITLVSSGSPLIFRVFWLLNDGSGNFSFSGPIITGPYFTELDLADIDNDGDLDLIGEDITDELNWYENLGGGVFGTPNLIYSGALDMLTAFEPVDFNDDGWMDLLVIGDVPGFYQNMTDGTFDAVVALDSGFWDAAVADVNGDLATDIITLKNDELSVRLNLGSGTFAPPVVVSGASPASVFARFELADLDNDGDIDIFSSFPDSVQTFFNDGSGLFNANSPMFSPFERMQSLLGRDFDSDGDIDIMSSFLPAYGVQ